MLSSTFFKGDYVKAEKLQREGLRISEKAHGKEHPGYALKLMNIASLLRDQVRLARPILMNPAAVR